MCNHWNRDTLWCVLVTMSTVGYGDYYPLTHVGRIVMVASMVAGTIYSSLIVAVAVQAVQFNVRESAFVSILDRRVRHSRREAIAAAVIQVRLNYRYLFCDT